EEVCLVPDKGRELRGNRVVGVVWGCTGVPSVPMGSAPAAFSTWVSTTSQCCSCWPSSDSSWQVLRVGPRAFEAAQVRD
ncbi:hypothetical protein Nmel_017790, partial [Mimus melanotis]